MITLCTFRRCFTVILYFLSQILTNVRRVPTTVISRTEQSAPTRKVLSDVRARKGGQEQEQ